MHQESVVFHEVIPCKRLTWGQIAYIKDTRTREKSEKFRKMYQGLVEKHIKSEEIEVDIDGIKQDHIHQFCKVI